jgi:RNA polymerase sigma-70 factor (ECF subfamily)
MNIPPDKKAFVTLIQENRKIIFKICNSYCINKNERDDLAQEIVYQLWRSFSKFNPDLKFSTWMYRVALNTAISVYRKEKKINETIEYKEQLIELEEDVGESLEKERQIDLLQKFIAELKTTDRLIIMLYLEEKSYAEMAEIVGITETNVATRINRIKDKLKNNFSQHID